MYSIVPPLPSGIFMIDILNSALIHLHGCHCVTFYCALSNNHLYYKLTPSAFYNFVTFFQTTKRQLVSFYSPLSLLFNDIFKCHVARPYAFFHKCCSIPKQCLHDMSYNQIACLFPGTHKLFREPLFDILSPSLSTPSEFLQMVVFSFHKLIFDIVSALFLETSFVV